MDKKIACLFINIDCNGEVYGSDNFKDNDFFSSNAINSFKKWNPDVDIHYITDDNFTDYLKELGISTYYNNISLIRLNITKALMDVKKYEKVIFKQFHITNVERGYNSIRLFSCTMGNFTSCISNWWVVNISCSLDYESKYVGWCTIWYI
jgi:hypothetical protein